MPKCTFVNNFERATTSQMSRGLAKSAGRAVAATPVSSDYQAKGMPSFNKQIGRNDDLFQVNNKNKNLLGIYDNAFANRQSTKSVFDFRKQPSRENMNKTESISSIDYATISNKEKFIPKLVTDISFRKQRKRDPIVYTHMNQMAQNIVLENSRDEREKIV